MRILFLLIMTTALFSPALKSQPVHLATFNIRFDNPNDSGNLWVDRAAPCAALIRFHGFDIVGTQEALKNQLDDLVALLPGFEYHGVGRDDGLSKGEHSAILIRKSRFRVLDKGDFWLSETPEKPGFGWDARINRICSWVKLHDKLSGREFYVFNAHYDHQGVKARVESSRLIEKKIRSIAGNADVVFMGDLNGNHQSEWYRHMASTQLKDALFIAPDPYTPSGSFNGFRRDGISKDIIDHIFVSNRFRVLRAGVITDTYQGKFPSDHFPVMAVLSF